MVTILMILAKIATLGLLKIKIFSNKCSEVTVFSHDVMSRISSLDSNPIVDVVGWAKFGNSSLWERSYHFIKIWQKKHVFEGWSWFKLNNLGLALGTLGTTLKFYASVEQRVKSKSRKVLGLIPTFAEVIGGDW